jgi:selenocysteine-specific elongation factor
MIVGTAGHIDHGKSALVTALTGRAVDRLAEERRRGITIDLNFAPLELPGLPPAGIVDVPGHEDFVRTMVAGASGIDLVLLVVDGAEGPRPQTWEHLAIVEQLRIPRGIPVITKSDLADPEWLELVAADLAQRLGASPVAFAAPAIVSAVTGQGIPELRARLGEEIARHRERRADDAFRMPLDRAFSLAGVGTVVTGTPWAGALEVGDTATILPGGTAVRVRSLEAYGRPVATAGPGARTAVGLAGVDRDAVARGDVLVTGTVPWRSTTALDAVVEFLPGAPPVRRRSRVRVHLGTAEVLARVYPRGDIPPGGSGLARLALEAPIVARGNDRIVLRSYSPVATIGGGRVVDPAPPRRSGWPAGLESEDPAVRGEALIARRRDGVPEEDLPLLLGLSPAATRAMAGSIPRVTLVAGRFVVSALTAALRARVTALVQEFHRAEPARPGLSLETLRHTLRVPEPVSGAVLDGMLRRGELVLREGAVAASGFVPTVAGGAGMLEEVQRRLEEAGLEPPTIEELEQRLSVRGLHQVLRLLEKEGRAVGVESNRYFSSSSLNRFVSTVRELAAVTAITPQGLREKLGISRKYLIPLLEWSDRTGLTRRTGDTRTLA